jgi:hypothetical protein
MSTRRHLKYHFKYLCARFERRGEIHSHDACIRMIEIKFGMEPSGIRMMKVKFSWSGAVVRMNAASRD